MSNQERQARLNAQINMRYEILKQWTDKGVPDGMQVPRSLTKVRLWVDRNLGIDRIGSSSSFTKTHREYGDLIAKIGELIVVLNATPKKRAKRSKHGQLKQWKDIARNYKKALVAAADRYATQSVALLDTKRLLNIAEQALESGEAKNRKTREAKNTPQRNRRAMNQRDTNNITRVEFNKRNK